MVGVGKPLIIGFRGKPEAPLLEEALSVLLRGGVVALPTDTVYGLVALPDNRKAIDRIYQIKCRDRKKPLVLLADGLEQARALADGVPDLLTSLTESFWPGPLTLVLRASDLVKSWKLDSQGKVGVRVSPEPIIRALIESLGLPLASTSANQSGQPECYSGAEVLASLDKPPDLLLDGDEIPRRKPSTVLDITGDRPRLLRRGAISKNEIARACGQEPSLAEVHVLFICTGNTCRSPMAEGLLRCRLPRPWRHRVEARSCGTGALPGMPATVDAVRAARKRGFDISGHRSQPLNLDLLEWADLVVAMEPRHQEAARQLSPASEICLMAPGGVPDPIGQGLEEYLKAIDLMDCHMPMILEAAGGLLGETMNIKIEQREKA